MIGTPSHPLRGRANNSGEATRARLMDAALELLSARGIDDVTVRDISMQAKSSSAAINYHFGSKAALLEEILRRQAALVTRRRLELLNSLGCGVPSIRALAEIVVLPMLDRHGEEFGPRGSDAVFLSSAAVHPAYAELLAELYGPTNKRLLGALGGATPHLSEDVRSIRWAMVKDLVNHAVANPQSSFNNYLRYMNVAEQVPLRDALIDVVTAIFETETTI